MTVLPGKRVQNSLQPDLKIALFKSHSLCRKLEIYRCVDVNGNAFISLCITIEVDIKDRI